jgi:hypothetical protein
VRHLPFIVEREQRRTGMSVRVLIPRHLARHVNDKSELDIEASDLRTALEVLSRDYQLGDILLTRDGICRHSSGSSSTNAW